MKQLTGIAIIIFCFVNTLLPAGTRQTETVKQIEEIKSVKQKFNSQDLVDVFIDTNTPTVIFGKLLDGTTIEIVSTKEGEFIKAILSPNKTMIASISNKPFVTKPLVWLEVFDIEYNIKIQGFEIRNTDKRLQKIVWSPNSKYIAICEDDYFGCSEINIYDAKTSVRCVLFISQIVFEKNNIQLAKTFPFIYEQNPALFRKKVAEAEIRDDGNDFYNPEWSFDSKRIYFEVNEKNCISKWVINIDGTGLKKISQKPKRTKLNDADILLFEQQKRIKFNPQDLERLVKVFIDTSIPNVIMGELSDGTTVVVLGPDELPRKANGPLFTSGIPLPVKCANFNRVKLSPDKTKIVFSHDDEHSDFMYLWNFNNKKARLIGSFIDGDAGEMYWSPDSKYVAYECVTGRGMSITVVDTDAVKFILSIDDRLFEKKGIKGMNYFTLEGCVFDFIKWSSDNKRIFFRIIHYPSRNSFEEWAINIDGSNLRKVK